MIEQQEVPAQITESALRLFKVVKKTVGNALFRAMQVAGKSDGKRPTKLRQRVLSEQSGVARSTIYKYLNAKDDPESSVNPDLKTLCRLADTLNVSPAMLLLTPNDWSRLAQAAVYLREAVPNEQVMKISAGMSGASSGPIARATAGLQLARLFGVYQEFKDPSSTDSLTQNIRVELIEEQQAAFEKKRIGIFVATSIPPLRELKEDLHPAILSLCANLGASTHPQ